MTLLSCAHHYTALSNVSLPNLSDSGNVIFIEVSPLCWTIFSCGLNKLYGKLNGNLVKLNEKIFIQHNNHVLYKFFGNK